MAGGRLVRWEVEDRSSAADSPDDASEAVTLRILEESTGRGPGRDALVRARYHEPAVHPRAMPGIVWVGGVGGGVAGPANGMYPRLARTLAGLGAASLRVDYRHPRDLEPCIADCIAGGEFVLAEGADPLALVGHSAGGAVVIAAGAALPRVATVVALATQSYGADAASRLAPASLLLLHGTADPVLPPSASVAVRRRSNTRTELRLLEGAGHSFEGHAEEAVEMVLGWLRRELRLRPDGSG